MDGNNFVAGTLTALDTTLLLLSKKNINKVKHGHEEKEEIYVSAVVD